MFDWVCVLNLDRRPDRWQRWRRDFPTDWPFKKPIRVPAIDGHQAAKPEWYPASAGAWGCLYSHRSIWATAIGWGLKSILVIEDDAVFCMDFARRVQEFLDAVPDDWDQLYFGGQYLHKEHEPPTMLDDKVLRCTHVNRTHAYAIRQPMLNAVAAEMTRQPQNATHERDYHVDHRLCRMHRTGEWNIYAPYRWLVGQWTGDSDIAVNKVLIPACMQVKWWNEFPILDAVPC